MTTMKALSVRNPFAHLIAIGVKTIELRCWHVSYRGPLLICSGSRPHAAKRHDIIAHDSLVQQGLDAPYGQAICVVDLVDIRPATALDARAACFEPNLERDWSWVLENPRAVPHVDIRGLLRLFDVDLDVTQLEGSASASR